MKLILLAVIMSRSVQSGFKTEENHKKRLRQKSYYLQVTSNPLQVTEIYINIATVPHICLQLIVESNQKGNK